MTDSAKKNKTTNLINSMTLTKEKELYVYKSKLLKLEMLMVQEPNNALYVFKYNLIKQRYGQLKRTAYKLRNLKFQLNKMIY